MVKKLVQAATLLKEKGYVEEKFDQEGFTECVYNWFKTHDLKDKLLIRPKRFLEMDNPPKGGWKDMTDVDEWLPSLQWEQQLLLVQKGQAVPFVFVDEPFVMNAVYMLRVMNGFKVKKEKKGVYRVTLV
ncbi:hypothetical protein [Prevotella melaninogenica]|uniref:hypothetical protein n=1 Tax=Prevotella melaninogenica TaxID=28132 RepID=UPI001BACF592|nr:hypothetical protein [Prevotella melaninogenica]QUB66120.1 hypothetical protein J5A57_03215 [Prevotella melaninogenica]